MSLRDDLINTPERESGGRIATARLEYQAQWALSLVFEQHTFFDQDYAVGVELHDDVVLLNGSVSPTQLHFYQVKTTKNDKWTLTKLFERGKEKDGKRPNSIIGKLYLNYAAFPKYTASLNCVSNARCAVLKDDRPVQPFKDAAPGDYNKFKEKLKTEWSTATDSCCELFRFVTSDLSLKDADGHLKGKLQNFIRDNIGPDVVYKPESLYLMLTDEFRRRSKAPRPTTGGFDQLIKDKAVTRHDVDEWLKRVGQNKKPPAWELAKDCLILSVKERSELRNCWLRYEVEVMDVGNQALLQARSMIREVWEQCEDAMSYDPIVEECLVAIREDVSRLIPDRTDMMLKAMILYEALEDGEGQEIQAAGAQLEEAERK